MQTLNQNELDLIGGAGPLDDAGTALQVAAGVGGAAALVPTPASPYLAGFAIVSGTLGTMLSYADSKIDWTE
ncbi:hypothetical protein [Qipengyuania sp. XHP0211]|uniref:hypothetical protein n=1 Tax=Qipengyuania TaxID=1855416 RepID=UPI00241F678F|nr:hypothetical protein [Qipengyuania sp. XHP0211]